MATPLAGIPLRIGSAQAFARVRQSCRDAGYDDDAALCRMLSVRELHEAGHLDWDKVDLAALPEALRWCIAVFFRGLATPETDARSICGEPAFAALLELGLLAPARQRPGAVVCPVWLYPVDGFLVASDRRDDAGGEATVTGDDVVFPGLDLGTIRLLRFMPEGCGGDALDLCGGCGIGALHLSRTARQAVTADVTPRATAFAEFNARLNDRPVACLCGDLYGPVQSRQFDLITAHPPYVPTYGRAYIFRDGGDSGEIIIRRIIAGLPEYLRPGGTALILCAGRDTDAEPFEQRAIGWLGAAARDFDIVFGVIKTLTIEEVLDSLQTRTQPMTGEEARELRGRLKALGTSQFAYGPLVFHRGAEPADGAPLRIRLGTTAAAADLARLLALRAFRRRADFRTWLSAARLRFAPNVEMVARSVADGGRLGPADITFRSDGAFQTALRPDSWMAPVLASLDGTRSTADVYRTAHGARDCPTAYSFDDFAHLIGLMMEQGILQVERDPKAQ